MKVIKKISIKRYRSIGDIEIDLDHINVFSGLNNVGKSNVLKALNLFFNHEVAQYDYERDYNKSFTESAGGKYSATIEVFFLAVPGSTGMLSKNFSVRREFTYGSKTPITTYHSEDVIIQGKIDNGKNINQFTKFLNKIRYYYIPAIRDKKFTKEFLVNFDTIIKQSSYSADFANNTESLSDILTSRSDRLSAEFEKFINLPTKAKLSSKSEDILGAIEINVKSGIKVKKKTNNDYVEKYVNIFSSGDGILMSYLVYFLNYLCKTANKQISLWGYEEPENSLEYSKVQNLAKNFYDEFSENAQILITTHSPAFINLRNLENVKMYRVFMFPPEHDFKRLSQIKTLGEIELQLSQLSLFNDDDRQEYIKLSQELHLSDLAKEIETTVNEVLEKHRSDAQDLQSAREILQESYPEKVFICEDVTAVELWQALIDDSTIKVISSRGCSGTEMESALADLKKIRPSYNPKVFRTVDRDGYTDAQISFIEAKINQQYEFPYKYKILPVCEIENFAIINNSDATDILWNQKKDMLKNDFIKTAEANLTRMRNHYRDEHTLFGLNNQYFAVASNMFDEAAVNWRYFVNGKGLIENFNCFAYIKANPPQELVDLVAEIKQFLN